jgi:hypothetical protein
VTRPERQLKTVDDQLAMGPGGGGGGAAGAGGMAAAQKPPTDTPTGGQEIAGDDVAPTTQGPAPKVTAAAGAAPAQPGAYDQARDAKLTEWAERQHKQMVTLVKAGNCTEAGKLGTELAAQAPEYYAAHVENDRAVRGCKQYIDQAKRKKANEAYKSRAKNAYDADEAMPAAN